jgi:iron(III) transport system permease protein
MFDTRLQSLAINTLQLIGGACLIAIPLGTLLAFLVVKTDLPGRRVLAVLLGALLFVPLYLQAGAWQAGFGLQGWYTLASTVGSTPWLAGMRGAIWVHAMAAVPWVAVIVGLGLWTQEPEHEEEALLDAARGRVFWRVTAPRTLSSMLLAALWVAVVISADITVSDLFLVRTFAEEVYSGLAIGDWTGGEPLSIWAGAGVTGLLAIAAAVVCSGLAPPAAAGGMRSSLKMQLGAARRPTGVAAWSLVAVLLGVPLVNLVYKAGMQVTQVGAIRERSWLLEKCASLVFSSPQEHGAELVWSLEIAACAALLAMLIAVPLAWWACGGGRRAIPAIFVAAVGLAVPGPILGIALIRCFSAADARWLLFLYDRTIAAPVLAQTVKAAPLAILVLWYALATVPRDALAAAKSEGASSWGQLARIALPQRLPAVLAAAAMAFIIALGELSATILVLPPGIMTLPVRIFGLLHYGVEDQVASVALAMIGVSAVVGLAALLLLPLVKQQE